MLLCRILETGSDPKILPAPSSVNGSVEESFDPFTRAASQLLDLLPGLVLFLQGSLPALVGTLALAPHTLARFTPRLAHLCSF